MSAMCDYYYICKIVNSAGEHGIHSGRCNKIPCIIHREYLGLFDCATDAEAEALKRGYKKVATCSCKSCQHP